MEMNVLSKNQSLGREEGGNHPVFPDINIDSILTSTIPQNLVDEIYGLLQYIKDAFSQSQDISDDHKKEVSKIAFTLTEKLYAVQKVIGENNTKIPYPKEKTLIIGQIRHLLQPLTTIHSTISDLNQLDPTSRDVLLNNTLPYMLGNVQLISDMQRAMEFIPDQLKLFDKVQREGVKFSGKYIGSLIESVFITTDMNIEIDGETDKNINMVHLSLMLQNIATNYKKYGIEGNICIELRESHYHIFTDNKLKDIKKENTPYSGGDGYKLMRESIRLGGGELIDSKDDTGYYLRIENIKYMD